MSYYLFFIIYMLSIFNISCSAESFNGLYLGGNTSLVQRENSIKIPQSETIQQNVICRAGEINDKKRNPYSSYGIFVGMGQRFSDNTYLGGELSFETHNVISNTAYQYPYLTMTSSSSSTPPTTPSNPTLVGHSPVVNNSTPPLNAKASLITRYERGSVLSLGLRAGCVLENETLVYGRLSLERSHDTLRTTYIIEFPLGTMNSYYTQKKIHIILMPGIGIEKSFGKFHIRCEYNYNPGKKIRVKSAYDSSIVETHNYKSHHLKTAILYHF